MPFVYAATGSGPSAGGIGWFDFGSDFTIAPGQTVSLSGALRNGVNVSFDLTLSFLGGAARGFTAVAPPVNGGYFGGPGGGYTGLGGSSVVLLSDLGAANNLSNLIFSNIVVTDAQGNAMPNYTVVLADGENTSGTPGFSETLTFTTNGESWTQLAAMGNTNPPTVIGANQFVGFIGVSGPPNTAYVYQTASPTQVVASLQEPQAGDAQGVAIGFAATQVELYKVINGRRFPADQFALSVTGGPDAAAATTGAANGLQSAYASVAALPGGTYTLNEAMAPGSVSSLADYTQTVTAVNLTPGGTAPIAGPLPESVTPILGDVIQYTITNTPDLVVEKTVTPAYAQPGELLTYTVSVTNPGTASALTGVLVTDALPAGTTYANNLLVTVPFTGADPMSGITLTSIPPLSAATITWQVQVNSGIPANNPIVNAAVVTPESGVPVSTNSVSTQINFADLISAGSFVKTAAPTSASPGDIVTYTLTLTNSGTVAANNVVVTDPIPVGATYVPGSVTGTVPFTGTPAAGLHLKGPILPGVSADFSFKVQLDDTPPAVNPIPNTASVAYTYTVDPAQPNGESASGVSNTADVTVRGAALATVKAADKAIAYPGDAVTYSIAVTNNGNVPADNVVVSDSVPPGTTYVAGSLSGNVAFTGAPPVITLSAPLAPGTTAALSFRVLVGANPYPNPLRNAATVSFTFTVDPQGPDGVSGASRSNTVTTVVFRNNYGQQVSDLVASVALQEAALAAIVNAEGAKIQRAAATPGVTAQTLLCLNKSVTDTTESIALLEGIMKQKLGAVECQINGGCQV